MCDTCSAGEHLLTVLKERRLRQLQREGLVRRCRYTALAAVTCDCSAVTCGHNTYTAQVSMHGQGNSAEAELGQA